MKSTRLISFAALMSLPFPIMAAPPPPPPPPSSELRFELDGYAVGELFAAYRKHATALVRERFEAQKSKILAEARSDEGGRIDPQRLIGFEVLSMNGLLVSGSIFRRCADAKKQDCGWHYVQIVRDTGAITEEDFSPEGAVRKLKRAGIAPRLDGDYPPSIVEVIGPGRDQLLREAITIFATDAGSCPTLKTFESLWDDLPELAAEDFRTRSEPSGVEDGPWLKIAFTDYLSQYSVSSGVGQPEVVGATYQRIAAVLEKCVGDEWPVF